MVLGLLFLVPNGAWAFYNSDGSTKGSMFAVGDLSVAPDSTAVTAEIDATNSDTVSFSVVETGSIAAQYSLSASPVTCSAQFYSAIENTISGTQPLYDGLLAATMATSSGDTTFSIELSAGTGLQAVANETCTVELELVAWQREFADAQTGFTDTHTISLTITATEAIGPQTTTNAVLNELYPSILSTSTIPLEREWVELYNGTGSPIDVASWYVSEYVGGDSNGTRRDHVIVSGCAGYPASTTMQPYGTNDTEVPSGGFIVLEFCGTAEYMQNSGDTIELRDSSLALIDGHSYGTTPNGKSHARIPDGGTWVDPLPTPGAVNAATREDLEAEGWTEAQIDEVLGTTTAAVFTFSKTPVDDSAQKSDETSKTATAVAANHATSESRTQKSANSSATTSSQTDTSSSLSTVKPTTTASSSKTIGDAATKNTCGADCPVQDTSSSIIVEDVAKKENVLLDADNEEQEQPYVSPKSSAADDDEDEKASAADGESSENETAAENTDNAPEKDEETKQKPAAKPPAAVTNEAAV